MAQFQVSAVIAEPSAVAPDTKIYSGDMRRPTNREIRESRTQRLGGSVIFSIRRYRARFCNDRAYQPDPLLKDTVMNTFKYLRTCLLWCSVVAGLQPMPAFAQSKSNSNATTSQQQTLKQQDGQHDFDFEIGTWKTHLRRLLKPLTGSTTWVEYDGTTVVTKVWDGRANMVELVADGPAGHFEGLSLRLYNPQSHQWSLNFSGLGSGTIGPPAIGQFRNGRGEFYNQETLNDRAILVRFVISDITSTSCRFEQSFSEVGGKTWEG